MSVVSIRLMQEPDISFGMKLKSQVGWNQLESDWSRFLALQRDGCFVAEIFGTPVGTVVTSVFGAVAWIAMMLVDEPFRRQGVGKALMDCALNSLADRGVETVRLDATPLGMPLYSSLGFRTDFCLSRFGGSPRVQESSEDQRITREPLNDEILHLDSVVTHTDRSRMWRHLAPLSNFYVFREDRKVRGFAFCRPGEKAIQIGPVIGDLESGAKLLSHSLAEHSGLPVFVDVPQCHSLAIEVLLKHDLCALRTLTRMHRGTPVLENLDYLWASSGPEKG